MSTVKELLDEFSGRVNQPRESAYVTGTTPNAIQLTSGLRFISGQLLRKPGDWSCLKRLYVFTTQTGVSLYQLPGDHYRSLSQTQYGVTTQMIMGGPLTDSNLAYRTYGISPIGIFPSYQPNGPQGYVFNTSPYTQKSAGYFQITPPGPDNVTQYVIGYISRNYFWPTAWLPNHSTYAVGNIVTGIANMYICTAITTGISGTTRPSVTTGSVVDGGVTWTVYTEPYPLQADTDFSIFDDEIMIEGMRWYWYQTKKQQYTDIKADWENSVKTELGRAFSGAVVNAGYDVNIAGQWPNISVGSWPGTGGG